MTTAVQERESRTFSVSQGMEVVVRMKNRCGILAEIAKLVSDQGLNVLALNGAKCGEDCVVRLMTDDNLRAKDVLAEKNFEPQEEGVVIVELANKPGMLKRVADTLANEGIDICHVYATAGQEDDKCLLVFHSSDDEHALVTLQGG